MKMIRYTAAVALSAAFLAVPLVLVGADKDAKVKPYTLKTCPVSGEKLGEMGKAYVITNDMREIKFCCKGCLKDFKKDPAKYLKKIDEEAAKAKKAKS